MNWTGLFEAGLGQPRISVKLDFRSESFKRKFSTIFFGHKRLLNEGIKKTGLKFNLGLPLIGLRTTGPLEGNTFGQDGPYKAKKRYVLLTTIPHQVLPVEYSRQLMT